MPRSTASNPRCGTAVQRIAAGVGSIGLAAAGIADRRQHFVLVIPVAESPAQLRRCLASLLELCRAFGYGGMRDGCFSRDVDAQMALMTWTTSRGRFRASSGL
ncbi:MAG: hypothetical protein U0932_12105 [Thiobacillus sp.]|nr:hypothetical protein [Thiobacillus sp.]